MGGAKNLAESLKVFAESATYDFLTEIEQKNEKFIDFLQDLVTESVFYSTFCQKKDEKRETVRFLPEFTIRFQKIWQKVLEIFAESRACFRFLPGETPPPAPPPNREACRRSSLIFVRNLFFTIFSLLNPRSLLATVTGSANRKL